MQSRNESRASPKPPGATGMHPNMYQYSMAGNAYAPLPKDDLSQAFANLSLPGYNPNNASKMSVPGMAPGLVHMSVNSGQAPGQFYYAFGNRYLPINGSSGPEAFQQSNGSSGIGHYMQPTSFPTTQPMPNGSQNVVWTSAPHTTNELPELAIPRRNSFSSNEETGPHTPFFGTQTAVDYQPKINGPDNSPQAWGTPSPQQLGPGFYPQPPTKENSYMLYNLDALCQQDPPIPRPIPAIFSGEKGRGTLESSLMNKLNTTNVYIRGLHPNTTDNMLWDYGARFGTIDSAKSMMDQQTGTCKGFGFIKYHNFADGSNCIRGFYHWGYEAKWARVSHNEKLKNLGDRNNTNLYVSGIPTDVDFNEHSLMAIFGDFKCLSSKILRDPNGLSRGVGFARFETPEECYKIIEEYNNKPIGQDGNPISVRFADTADQKKLKQETQQRRQFKTHEYNVAAFGPNSPYQQLSPVVAAFSTPIQTRSSPVVGTQWQSPGQITPFWQTPNGLLSAYPSPVMTNNISTFRTPGSENIAPARQHNVRAKIETPPDYNTKLESPSAAALAKRSVTNGNIQSPVKSGDKTTSVPGTAGGLSHIEIRYSPVKSIKSSPPKQSPSKSTLLNL